MTEPRRDEVEVGVAPAGIRAILADPERLGRIFPGCESAERLPDGRAAFVIANRLGFMTVRADVVGSLTESDAPDHLLLVLDGRTRGLEGTFRAAIEFTLLPTATGTRVRYGLETEVGGAVAMMGRDGFEASIREQVGTLVERLEREAEAAK